MSSNNIIINRINIRGDKKCFSCHFFKFFEYSFFSKKVPNELSNIISRELLVKPYLASYRITYSKNILDSFFKNNNNNIRGAIEKDLFKIKIEKELVNGIPNKNIEKIIKF